MKDKKHIKSFNEATENLNISDVSRSFTIQDLKNAFNAEKVKYRYYRGVEKGIIDKITFEEWYKENYD